MFLKVIDSSVDDICLFMRPILIMITDNLLDQLREVHVMRNVFILNTSFCICELPQFRFLFVYELIDVFSHIAVVFILPTAIVRNSFDVDQQIEMQL